MRLEESGRMFLRCWSPLVMLISGLGAGCATVSSGSYAGSVDEQGRPLSRAADEPLISAGELTDLSSPYFGALEITFENESSEWIRITGVELDFGSPELNQAVFVPAGQDLQSWQDATSTRNAIAQTNRETALGLIALGAAVLGAVSDRGSAGEVLGGLALLGSVTVLTVGEYAKGVKDSERVKLFPSTHLFGGPFGVPPGLFIKRWVVLNTQGVAQRQCLRAAYLAYDLGSRGRRRVRLDYGDDAASSVWQRSVCQRAALQKRATAGRFAPR
jgi:hypothetical protein